MTKTHEKIVVTAAAAVLVVLHQWVKFDTIALGLLFIAVLPWLSSFLQSAELPGGWKFQFDQVREEQLKQKDEIERLKFLIEGFVSADELKHLERLNSNEPFSALLIGKPRLEQGRSYQISHSEKFVSCCAEGSYRSRGVEACTM